MRLWVALVLAFGLWPVPAVSQNPPLDRVTTARGKGWLARELRRFRTFPHLDRAYRLLDAEQWDDARIELEAYLAVDPLDLEVGSLYLMLLHRIGDHEAAIEQSDRLLARRSGFGPDHYYRALAHERLGDAAAALTDARAAAEAQTATEEQRLLALELWADLAVEMGQVEEARGALDALGALKANGAAVDAFRLAYRRGWCEGAAGHHGAALEAYRQATAAASVDQQRQRAWQGVADTARRLSDDEAAYQARLQLARLEPSRAEHHRELAALAERRGDRERAGTHLRAAVAVTPRAEDFERLGHLLVGADPGAAADALRQALTMTDEASARARLLLALGRVELGRGRTGPGVEAFRASLAVRPSDTVSRTLAKAELARGNRVAALEAYRAITPPGLLATDELAMGTLAAETGDDRRARLHLTRVADTAVAPGERFAALRRLGFLAARVGDDQAARLAFERARPLAPGPDTALDRALGEVCSRLGDHEAAAHHFAASLSAGFDPIVQRSLARSLIAAGDQEAALRLDHELLARLEPPPLDLVAEIADLEVALGQPARAATLLEEAMAAQGDPSGELARRAVSALVAAERPEDALALTARMIERSDLGAPYVAEAWLRRGRLQAGLERWAEAARSLSAARTAGRYEESLGWELGSALVRSARYEDALVAFLAPEYQRSARAQLFAARCFDQLGKSGLALHYLKAALGEPAELTTQEHRLALEEVAHLNDQQASYAAAAVAWKARLDMAYDAEVALRYGTTLARLERDEEALAVLEAIAAGSLIPAGQANRLDVLGSIAGHRDQRDEAITHFEQAYQIAPTPERAYRLALALRDEDQLEAARAWFDRAVVAAPSVTRYREAQGYTLLALEEWERAIAAFESVVADDRDYLALYEDLGYLHLAQAENERAIEWFRQSIDNRPFHPIATGRGEARLDEQIERLRIEIAKVSDRLDATVYLQARGDDLPSSAASATAGGALPSQGGVEIAFQPPGIGFRNERVFQFFGRVLTDIRPASLDPVEPSYQGGVGVRYKPLRSQNVLLSFERLFEIGAQSQNNWLARALYSWDRGVAPRPGQRRWSSSFVFFDAAYLLDSPRYWAVFAEVRQGIALPLGSRILATPHLLVSGRYQEPGGGNSSYFETGAGVSIRFALARGNPTLGAAAVQIFLQYRRGRFFGADRALTDRTFDGVVTTAVMEF